MVAVIEEFILYIELEWRQRRNILFPLKFQRE
jgi:hypothetical protein